MICDLYFRPFKAYQYFMLPEAALCLPSSVYLRPFGAFKRKASTEICNPYSSFEVSRRGSDEAGNAVLAGMKTMPVSHMARITIHQNGEGNADFITIRASCKTLQVANQHGLLSPLEDWETKSFGGLLRFSPNLPNSEPPSGKSKERFRNCLCGFEILSRGFAIATAE